jgi:hypothetical protein
MKTTEYNFYKILDDIGVDNSMGDYNYLLSSFIDKNGLGERFEDFVIESFKNDLIMMGENDYYDSIDGRLEKRAKFINKKMQEFYDLGWATTGRSFNE